MVHKHSGSTKFCCKYFCFPPIDDYTTSSEEGFLTSGLAYALCEWTAVLPHGTKYHDVGGA